MNHAIVIAGIVAQAAPLFLVVKTIATKLNH
jgi:hypothetical protein